MSKISYIIGESNTEKVRRQIAFILSDELANQAALINAEPSPTPEMELTLKSIPARVYDERFIRPSSDEFPVLNVVLVNNPINEITGIEQQTDTAKFNIEYYSKGISSVDSDGDAEASLKLQRGLMLCRHILMSPNYLTLDFPDGIIGRVSVNGLEISQPDKGADSGYIINGKITVDVKILETQNKLEGVPLNVSATTHQLYDTDKGYYYEL